MLMTHGTRSLQARVTPKKSPATHIFLKKFLAKSGESETSQEEQTKDVSSAYLKFFGILENCQFFGKIQIF